MEKGKHSIVAVLMMFLAMTMTTVMASCSDDDDGKVSVDFGESTVAGTWQIIQMDSVVLETSDGGGLKRTIFETEPYENVFAVIGNGSYTIWQNSASNVLDHGTYSLVTSSFRLDLSSADGTTTQVHWLKTDLNIMTLEVYNSNDGTRRARYTLRKQ